MAITAAFFTRNNTRSPSNVVPELDQYIRERCTGTVKRGRAPRQQVGRQQPATKCVQRGRPDSSSSASTTRPRCQRIQGEARCVTSSMLPCSVSPVLSMRHGHRTGTACRPGSRGRGRRSASLRHAVVTRHGQRGKDHRHGRKHSAQRDGRLRAPGPRRRSRWRAPSQFISFPQGVLRIDRRVASSMTRITLPSSEINA